MKRIIVFALISLMVLAVLFVSCSKKPLKGTEVQNQAPQIFFANTPPDSTQFSASPIIFWYGTDADGEIWQYCYVDLSKTKYLDDFNNYYLQPGTIPDSLWICIEEPSDTLFFSLDPGDTMTEHLFCVKAIDNDNAYSPTICRIYFRKNIPPQTEITSRYTDADTFWCLKDTTSSWKGISFTWVASDPDNSILFQYYWYILNSARDTVKTSGGWIPLTNMKIKDIPTGNYYFYVKSRDDAFAEDATPDSIPLNIVKPYFDWTDSSINYNTMIKMVLFVDENISGGLGDPKPDALVTIQNSYRGFLDNLISDNMIDEYAFITLNTGEAIPMSILGNCLCVYWVGIDIQDGMSQIQATGISSYMDIGGRFGIETRTLTQAGTAFQTNYLGLSNVYNDGTMQGTRRDYYFQKALPKNSSYELLELDTIKTTSILRVLPPSNPPIVYTLPSVNVLQLMPNYRMTATRYAESFYGYGVFPYDSTSPRFAQAQLFANLPVAVSFVNGDARSITMSFPLCLMNNADNKAYATFKRNIEYLTTKRTETF